MICLVESITVLSYLPGVLSVVDPEEVKEPPIDCGRDGYHRRILGIGRDEAGRGRYGTYSADAPGGRGRSGGGGPGAARRPLDSGHGGGQHGDGTGRRGATGRSSTPQGRGDLGGLQGEF